jgi:hypothetical protein
MKTCLICDCSEANGSLETDFICSKCVNQLRGMKPDELGEKYVKAIEEGRKREAYALFTFVPRRIREANPLPKMKGGSHATL